MTERLLQYIWQYQQYNLHGLYTTNGESLLILHPGTLNTNQGPDFLDAKIKVGNTIWAGNIELHTNASHWQQHGHDGDKQYSNVILHVVWKADKLLPNNFPTLELRGRVSLLLLHRYEALMQAEQFIPCQQQFSRVPSLVMVAWQERLLVERLQQKAAQVSQYLTQTKGHWEVAFWWLIARNFGTPVNSDAFECIAQSIPLKVLTRHKNNLQQLEALLLGQAGLLENATDDYTAKLRLEYLFLQQKYKLVQPDIRLQFLRMRPASFPTVRLAQLAMLIHQSVHLFAQIRESDSLEQVSALLDVTASPFWNSHYTLEQSGIHQPKKLGQQMVNNILINTVIPAVFSYGQQQASQLHKDRAMDWLELVAAEKNTITRGFEALGATNGHAMQSQSWLHLKKEYCDKKRCLSCAIGANLLRQ